MLALFEMFILISAVLLCGVYRVSAKWWTPAIAAILAVFTVYSHIPIAVMIIVWAVFVVNVIVWNIPLIRQRLLSQPVMNYIKTVLPPMSSTERIALDAGDVWWEGELFKGQPNWRELHAIRKPELTAEEQAFLDHEVTAICDLVNDYEIVKEFADMPKVAWQYACDKGFLGLIIPKEYGGRGFSPIAHSAIVTKLASRSMSMAVNLMVPNSLGPAELLLEYGTTAQKDHYLPRLARGQEIPCFGLTSPTAGSDAGSITDSGVICKSEFEGQQVLGIKLNWSKHYITLAPVATLIGIAFKCHDPEHLLGDETFLGITLALIPAQHPGVTSGERHNPAGCAFMNGPIEGRDVFIPLDWIIGGQQMIGQGWRMLMECLSVGRAISLPALSAAVGQVTYRTTGAYARVREQFSMPIGRFPGVAEALAQIGGLTYSLNATRVMTADAVGQGIKPSLVSGIAKYHMTEMARKVLDHAMDVQAGKAIQLGPTNYIGLMHHCMPVAITVEGANILTRNLIIFGQGAMRCHPYLRREIELAQDDNAKLSDFDDVLVSHIGHTWQNALKSFLSGFTRSRFIKVDAVGVTQPYYQKLTRMSTTLAWVADLAMLILGGDLKRQERLSARLGDVLSHLYLASCALKYYKDQGEKEVDWMYCEWALQHHLYNIQQAFEAFFANFAPGFKGKILKRMVFPWGRPYRKPSDAMDANIAEHMLKPSEARDRFTELCYLGKDENDAYYQLEQALAAVINAKPLYQKIKKARRAGEISKHLTWDEQLKTAVKQNIITEAECTLIKNSDALRNSIINVDRFAFDALSKVKQQPLQQGVA